MEYKTFSLIESIKYGFSALYNNTLLFLVAGLIHLCFSDVLVYLFKVANPLLVSDWAALPEPRLGLKMDYLPFLQQHGPLLLLVVPLYCAVYAILQVGMIQLFLDVHDTGTSRVSRLFSWFGQGYKAVGVYSLTLLIATIPMAVLYLCASLLDAALTDAPIRTILLVVALDGVMVFVACILSLYCMAHIGFSLYSLVDTNRSIASSLKHSVRISRGHALKLCAFWMWYLVVALLFDSMGTIVVNSIGLMFNIIVGLALAYIYRKLSPADRIA